MRHFDAWILRDPYSIWHYYSTGRRWQESVRDMIQSRQICAPPVDLDVDSSNKQPVSPLARSISSQPNCGKLPPEIRLMIYGHIFGDEAVHLVQLKGKIRHVRCCKHKSASDIPSHRRCCPETMARWRSSSAGAGSDSRLYPHTHKSLLGKLSNSSPSLLQTCRAIYLEAADMPYSTLSFDVDDLHTFVAFSLTISPEHLARIKRLTVQWTPIWQPMTSDSSSSSAGSNKSSIYSHTHNDHIWKLFWSRVQALEGLETLYLNLDLGRFMGNAMNTVPDAPGGVLLGGANNQKISLDVAEPWLQPLKAVRGLKNFDMCVSARCDASARNMLVAQIGAEAVVLRDCLREVMCLPREPSTTRSVVPVSFLRDTAASRGMHEYPSNRNVQRPQRMITAA
ncbi:hypothetical protein TMatcc_004009 [Talaromyces marneffei ATCC 18224]|uniref:DUF7730 domain-containing protein n=1 Tax=Talaromyces marneffei (strain ATCC 18224 / CBS 334.59 / QM 7333) TaxID=441960 RepID=B6Q705_TALMQ|nr:hypothetical protein PMAA_025480 [Talaromyces marneffei ATCC 18224]